MNLVTEEKTDIDVSVDVQTTNSGQKRNKCNGLSGRESHIEKQMKGSLLSTVSDKELKTTWRVMG